MLKTNYDRGDCDHIISCNETILPICNEYTFIPNTTVKQFSENTDHYPVGTIDVLVTPARRIGTLHNLQIKYGSANDDKAMVILYLTIYWSFNYSIFKSHAYIN